MRRVTTASRRRGTLIQHHDVVLDLLELLLAHQLVLRLPGQSSSFKMGGRPRVALALDGHLGDLLDDFGVLGVAVACVQIDR